MVFVRDGKSSTDCLDGTDEVSSKQKAKDPNDFQCPTTRTFQCEELNTPSSLTPNCFTGTYNMLMNMGKIYANILNIQFSKLTETILTNTYIV